MSNEKDIICIPKGWHIEVYHNEETHCEKGEPYGLDFIISPGKVDLNIFYCPVCKEMDCVFVKSKKEEED